jgi:hypothetical protein
MTKNSTNKFMNMVGHVSHNVYWAQNALELYEGVSQHAEELNQNFGHFFGLTQNFSLDCAVVGICKIFDTSNPGYDKDTVPALMDYLKHNLTDAYISRLSKSNLTALFVSDVDAERIVGEFENKCDFEKTKNEMLVLIGKSMPNPDSNPSLKKLFLFRNKVAAHPERLNDVLREELGSLPSMYEMEQIIKWAGHFCELSTCVMSNEALLPFAVSARMAALDVAAKVLEKTFDDSSKSMLENEEARNTFYKKPT